MENFKQCIYLLFWGVFAFTACTKENIAASTENNSQQPANSNNATLSIIYNNVSIEPSGKHVFSIPDITQTVIDKGSVTVYATDNSSQMAQWNLIGSCKSSIDIASITVGKVEVQNNMDASVSMSFRFDIGGK